MNTAQRLALFDLDGTLIDSAPDLADALDFALHKYGLPRCGEYKARDFIGNGAARLVHRAITDSWDGRAEDSVFNPIFDAFLSRYEERLFCRSSVYPNVEPVLSELVNNAWTLAVVTNKPGRFSTPLLELAGIADYFAAIISGDSLAEKKPDPLPLVHLLEQFSVSPNNAVMVGDSITDVEAASNAGVTCYVVAYGYHGNIDLAGDARCQLVDSFTALGEALNRTHRD